MFRIKFSEERYSLSRKERLSFQSTHDHSFYKSSDCTLNRCIGIEGMATPSPVDIQHFKKRDNQQFLQKGMLLHENGTLNNDLTYEDVVD
jgi:hypothetical protein